MLAVAAPRSVELYEPQLVWLIEDKLLKVVFGQLHNWGGGSI